MQKVIGIAGFKGAGKDTFAELLYVHLTRLGFWPQRSSFAAALKSMLVQAMHFTWEQLTEPDQKELVDPRWGVSPREAMRFAGEAFRGRFGEDFWVRRLALAFPDMPLLIVSDVRNDAEASWVKSCGKLILVRRPAASFDGHSTEELASRPDGFFDLVVENAGTITELDAATAEITRKLAPWLKGEV